MGRPDKDFAERLIAKVKRRPFLYDVTHPEYKDRNKVDTEWMEIGLALDISGDLAKKKWQNLRGSFSKSLQGQTMPSGSEAKKSQRFYLHDQMAFLESFMVHGPMSRIYSTRSSSELREDEDVDEVKPLDILLDSSSETSVANNSTFTQTSSTASQTSSTSMKRKRDPESEADQTILSFLQREAPSTSTDSVWEFFKGLVPQVKELSKKRQRTLFRSVTDQLFSLLQEQEEEEEQLESQLTYM